MNNLSLLHETFTNGYRSGALVFIDASCIVLAISVIISKNPIVSVLFLIGLFIGIASHLLVSGMNFIGLSYLLVYVGAVSILFLFILMLINIRISELLNDTSNTIPLALIIGFLFIYPIYQALPCNFSGLGFSNSLKYIVGSSISPNYNDNSGQTLFVSSKLWDGSLAESTHISSIGDIMYSSYSIWLILTSIILLLAMVGAIVITIKQPQTSEAHNRNLSDLYNPYVKTKANLQYSFIPVFYLMSSLSSSLSYINLSFLIMRKSRCFYNYVKAKHPLYLMFFVLSLLITLSMVLIFYSPLHVVIFCVSLTVFAYCQMNTVLSSKHSMLHKVLSIVSLAIVFYCFFVFADILIVKVIEFIRYINGLLNCKNSDGVNKESGNRSSGGSGGSQRRQDPRGPQGPRGPSDAAAAGQARESSEESQEDEGNSWPANHNFVVPSNRPEWAEERSTTQGGAGTAERIRQNRADELRERITTQPVNDPRLVSHYPQQANARPARPVFIPASNDPRLVSAFPNGPVYQRDVTWEYTDGGWKKLD